VPELLKVAGKEHLEGMIVGLASWPGKALGDLEKRFVAKTGEPCSATTRSSPTPT